MLVGTPIGNLEDITLRALKALREADMIAAEDTRTTRKLLAHYDIHTPLLSYCGEKEKERSREVVRLVREGKSVALVSESGMPGVSDPGWLAVRACREEGLRVEVVPGPSSLSASLSLAGLPPGPVCFYGFLPSRSAARRRLLRELSRKLEALVLYESPHRLKASLADMVEALGERKMILLRELTKLHEEVREGCAADLLKKMGEEKPRGEWVLVIWPLEPEKEDPQIDWEALLEEVSQGMKGGLPLSEACRRTAAERGVSRRELYARCLRSTPK